ncbi:transglycosylase domain-containing protein [Candidatus Finniella inopinata]|nr:PBP1A family penicillin-binding protein [Candidatus Finniella inopinata]
MMMIWGVIVLGLLILWFSHDLPDLKNIQINSRKPSVTVQSYDGAILGTYGDLYEDMVQVHDLPPYVPQALMAVEDRRFYHHFGVDIIGLIRATYANYRAKRVVQGGSTLTQQLAKNILFTQGTYNINDRSYKRKIQEVLLAIWLELKFSKDQILTLYLNRVYFGSGTYGVDAAARRYFNKSARNLTVFEAAVVAGLLKAPSKYSPAQHPKRAKERAKVVLELMVGAGFIRDYQSYLEQGEKELADNARERDQGVRHFSDWVYETLPQIVGAIDKDLIVITTLDVGMQRHAERVCKHYLEEMGKDLKVSETALIAMTPSGAIKAMVGGKDYGDSQFNRVTQALRQAGSAFKTLIYLAALESGMTPDSMMDDTPFEQGNWKPSNFKWRTRGMVTLREGMAHSVNSVSIRLTQQVTPKKVAEVAKRLGITSRLSHDLSISLGTGEATLLELATAYATFANQGLAVWPYGIWEIRDKSGNILYQHPNNPGKQIVNTTVLQGMRDMLRAVVETGSGRAANIDASVAGKTGSNGDKDAWFFGYRENQDDSENKGYSNIVVGVWVGNDNNKPMAKVSTGGRMPTRIAASFFKGENFEQAVKKGEKPKSSSVSPAVQVPAEPPKKPSLEKYLNRIN